MPTASAATPSPLPGCTPLFDAAALRDADFRAATDYAMPSVLLMERAGLAVARAILDRFPEAPAAVVLAGPGNNGGDGWVVARHLAEAGWAVTVCVPGGRPPRTTDGTTMAAIAERLGIPTLASTADLVVPPGAVLVDALLGTGATGPPRGDIGTAVQWLAAQGGPVVAADIPTGVESDTGHIPGPAVRADLTVTFHGDMPGLRVMPGRGAAGDVIVADIGIPAAVASTPVAWLSGPGARAAIPPKRDRSDKYGAGAVLVVAGSPGLTGAACLAARATLRAGAGLTVVAAPAAVQPAIAAQLLEVMCAPVPDIDGALAPASVDEVLRQAGRTAAVAVGPGLGRHPATTDAVARILAGIDLPVVLDADGLWHAAQAPEMLTRRHAPTVITPHTGEAARLLGVERAEVDAGRLEAARTLAARTGAVVVLKGAGTITADPGGTVVVNATGAPALATAGTGDVLTGVIAALLAKGMPPLQAAAAGVAVHGHAGEACAHGDGTIASDIIDALPAAIRAGEP